jgi:hypothetical protein
MTSDIDGTLNRDKSRDEVDRLKNEIDKLKIEMDKVQIFGSNTALGTIIGAGLFAVVPGAGLIASAAAAAIGTGVAAFSLKKKQELLNDLGNSEQKLEKIEKDLQ